MLVWSQALGLITSLTHPTVKSQHEPSLSSLVSLYMNRFHWNKIYTQYLCMILIVCWIGQFFYRLSLNDNWQQKNLLMDSNGQSRGLRWYVVFSLVVSLVSFSSVVNCSGQQKLNSPDHSSQCQYRTSQHNNLTSQHNNLTSQHNNLTSQHNNLTV